MDRKIRWLSKTARVVGVKMKAEANDNTAERLTSILAGAISTSGVSIVGRSECASGFALRAEAQTDCRRGSFGPLCRLSLLARLSTCDTKETLVSVDLSDNSFIGTSPRGERYARRQMWVAVFEIENALVARLRAGLSSVLPLD